MKTLNERESELDRIAGAPLERAQLFRSDIEAYCKSRRLFADVQATGTVLTIKRQDRIVTMTALPDSKWSIEDKEFGDKEFGEDDILDAVLNFLGRREGPSP